MKTWQAAVAVLRETKNPGVMWGDAGLLDTMHSRAGLKPMNHPLARWKAVLDNLSKCPGILVAGTTLVGIKRRVRIFWLPEHAPP